MGLRKLNDGGAFAVKLDCSKVPDIWGQGTEI